MPHMTHECAQGFGPGQLLQVSTSSGPVNVQVPAGIAPGMAFKVAVPNPQPVPVAAATYPAPVAAATYPAPAAPVVAATYPAPAAPVAAATYPAPAAPVSAVAYPPVTFPAPTPTATAVPEPLELKKGSSCQVYTPVVLIHTCRKASIK